MTATPGQTGLQSAAVCSPDTAAACRREGEEVQERSSGLSTRLLGLFWAAGIDQDKWRELLLNAIGCKRRLHGRPTFQPSFGWA